MTPRIADASPRLPAGMKSSPKHAFERDPILIPRLFVEKPWYRRRSIVIRVVAAVGFLSFVALVIHRYSMEGLLGWFANMIAK